MEKNNVISKNLMYEITMYFTISGIIGMLLYDTVYTFSVYDEIDLVLHLPVSIFAGLISIFFYFFYNSINIYINGSKLKVVLLIIPLAVFLSFIFRFFFGYLFNYVNDLNYWDYSSLKYNFMGIVSLQTLIIDSIFTIIYYLYIHKEIDYILSLVSKDVIRTTYYIVTSLLFISIIVMIFEMITNQVITKDLFHG